MNDSIQELIDEFDLRVDIEEPVGGYSRGMLQKLSLIISIMTNAEVLFLDEPTLGLDFQSSKQLSLETLMNVSSGPVLLILVYHIFWKNGLKKYQSIGG